MSQIKPLEKINLRFWTIIIIIWILDFISKYYALEFLDPAKNPSVTYHGYSVIGEWFRLRLTYNTGGVFGIFQGNAFIFHMLTGIAILFLLFYYIKTADFSRLFQLSIAFILGGALGNFTDRFFRPGVVDFIDMGIGNYRWPTYNIADSFITVGAVLLAVAFYQIEKKRPNNSSEESGD